MPTQKVDDNREFIKQDMDYLCSVGPDDHGEKLSGREGVERLKNWVEEVG